MALLSVPQLNEALSALQAQVAALAKRIENLESLIATNQGLIGDLETRYDQIAADAVATIARLDETVAGLEATDEASGWKQWKEQQRQQRGTK